MADVGGQEEVAAAGQCFDLLKTIATSKNRLFPAGFVTQVGRRVGKYFPARVGNKIVGYCCLFNESIAFVPIVSLS